MLSDEDGSCGLFLSHPKATSAFPAELMLLVSLSYRPAPDRAGRLIGCRQIGLQAGVQASLRVPYGNGLGLIASSIRLRSALSHLDRWHRFFAVLSSLSSHDLASLTAQRLLTVFPRNVRTASRSMVSCREELPAGTESLQRVGKHPTSGPTGRLRIS